MQSQFKQKLICPHLHSDAGYIQYLFSTVLILFFLTGQSFMDEWRGCGRTQTECLQDVCTGSKLPISVTLDWQFHFYVLTEFGIEVYRCRQRGMLAQATRIKIQIRQFLSISADSSFNPVSSFATLCRDYSTTTGERAGLKIINIASYFTCCFIIVFRLNTGDQST